MLIDSGLNGLTSRDFKLLSSEQKKISLYDELFENGESGAPGVSTGLPIDLQDQLDKANETIAKNQQAAESMGSFFQMYRPQGGWSGVTALQGP